MDVRNWPMDKIMRLPDHAFGSRWPVSVTRGLTGAGAGYASTETTLPENFVVWEILTCMRFVTATSMEICLAIGNATPANEAAFLEMPRLLPQISSQSGYRGAFDVIYLTNSLMTELKIPVVGTGRRIVGRFIRTVGNAVGAEVILTVSSLPVEVPDWMC